MFSQFEKLIDPFAPAPDRTPPDHLWSFYAFYVRQVWPILAVLMVIGAIAAGAEVALFAFLGKLVDLAREAASPEAFFDEHGPLLLLMLSVALILRPAAFLFHSALLSLTVVPGFTNRIRWQTHRWVLRQNLAFFQNDFAGRIANHVMQTGPALRESVAQFIEAVWFMTTYTTGAFILFMDNDIRLAGPLLLWTVLFVSMMVVFVPRVRRRAVRTAAARSTLTGRIVDSYTNIGTVKLFAHTEREDGYARSAIEDHTLKFRQQQRMILTMQACMNANNAVLIAGGTALVLLLWSWGEVSVGAIALTSSLIIRLVNMSGWIMWVVTSLFENVGMVQEGMTTIARPHGITDAEDAPPLRVTDGTIRFERITFHYGLKSGVIDDLSLTVRAGEKVGVVGRSGAGKSTLVNLLLRFYELEGGRILIDGQDIANVRQDSLRAQIAVVTQDTSLLHRSIRDNIAYGRPEASDDDVARAARQAHAHEFIPTLTDLYGTRGYAAQVGERGVKLSGGQRQRIAIARVLLKDAPILILDEATSALDSEVEAAIQEQLGNLMAGKTVIAIAHRLSTIAAMDRLIVLDRGRIVEEGSHAALVRKGGLYAELWARQSGGFLPQGEQRADVLV
jgi:ATP-binding cassette, subfamily B, multidrug efflux pump